MRTVKYLSILLVIVMLVPLTACTPKGSDTIRIGVIAPMTGDVKTFGDSTQKGAALAIEEWNAKGGVLGKKIEMVLADDKNDPSEATNAATKMIKQDKIKFIVGSVASSCSIPISVVANENKVIQISGTSTNAKLTVDPWPGGTRKEYVFRACFIDDLQGPAMAKFALENLGAKKAAVFYDNGNDYVKGLAETFTAAFEQGGGTVTVNEAYSKDDTDFSALITKVMADPPDMLYIPDYYNMVNLITKQARDAGFTGVFAGGDGWDSSDLNLESTEGGYFTNHYSSEDTRPEVRSWVEAYQAKHGTVPDALATLAYDAANMLLYAIQTANSEDTAKVKDALAATKDLQLVSGTVTIDENGNPLKDVTILQVAGGKVGYVTTVKP